MKILLSESLDRAFEESLVLEAAPREHNLFDGRAPGQFHNGLGERVVKLCLDQALRNARLQVRQNPLHQRQPVQFVRGGGRRRPPG